MALFFKKIKIMLVLEPTPGYRVYLFFTRGNEKMNSVVINDDGSLSDQEMDQLVPNGSDILVKIKAISINPVDIKKTPHTTNSKVLGYDAAGVVIGIGSNVKKFSINDHVYYSGTTQRAGSYADEQLVDENLVAKMPNDNFIDLAAMPLTWLTAAEILLEKLHYSMDPKENGNQIILIINGAGGVGSIITQLAHTIGLKVVATSSPKNFRWLKSNQVDYPIDYHHGIVKQVNELGLTIDSSVNLFNTGQYFGETIELVRPFGHLVNVTSTDVPIDVRKLQQKSLSFDWELMFTKSTFQYNTKSQGELLKLLSQILVENKIHTTRTKTITAPINADTIQQARQIVASHQMVGKLVIENITNK